MEGDGGGDGLPQPQPAAGPNQKNHEIGRGSSGARHLTADYNRMFAVCTQTPTSDCYLHAQMISAEAPMLFAKACEMFILELTLRSWYQTEESKRRTLQRSDVEDAVHGTEIFDFLVDTVPRQSSSSATQPQKAQQQINALRTKFERQWCGREPALCGLHV